MKTIPLTAAAAAFMLAITPLAHAQYPGYGGYPGYERGGMEIEEQLPDRAAAFSRAQAAYLAARHSRDQAQEHLLDVKRRVLNERLSTGEIEQAYYDYLQQLREYDQLRDEALSTLADNEDYERARQRAQHIDQIIAQVRNQPGTARQDIIELSQEHLRWSELAGSYRGDVLDQPRVQQAQRELVTAYRQYQDLLAQARIGVQDHPEVVDARQTVQDARQGLQVARANLSATRAGYRQAIALREAEIERRSRYAPYQPYYGGYWDDGPMVAPFMSIEPYTGSPVPGFRGEVPAFRGGVPSFGSGGDN